MPARAIATAVAHLNIVVPMSLYPVENVGMEFARRFSEFDNSVWDLIQVQKPRSGAPGTIQAHEDLSAFILP